MKISKSLFFIIATLFVVSACKNKKKEEVDPTVFTINNINIKDSTKLMFVLSDESANPANATGNKLYMISKLDKVSEINLSNTSGGDVNEILQPGQISNATPKYMLVNFTRATGTPSEAYFIDKKTGALTQIGDNFYSPILPGGNPLNSPFCKFDGNKSLYYVTTPPYSSKEFIKLDVSTFTKTNLLPDSVLRFQKFDIDNQGNIIAMALMKNNTNQIFAINGTTSKVLSNNFMYGGFWVANDGVFRLCAKDTVSKLEYNSANKKFVITPEISMVDNSITTNFYTEDIYRVYYSNKTILVNKEKIFEFDHIAKKVKLISSIPIIKTKYVDHSNTLGHVYVAGESSSGQETIFNIDLSNYSYKAYPESGKYTFYEIEAFEDGTIYATAKRKIDNKNVVLKFAPDGTETVLYDQLGTKKGVWLEKVTEFTND